MTEFDRLIDSGLRETEPQLPATIEIEARTYPGILSAVSMEDVPGFGGFSENVTAVFVLRKSEHPQKPRDKGTVTVNGERRKVAGVEDDAASWNIGLEDLE